MKNPDKKPSRHIAIIGGGVSWLSTAYFLEEADNINITLFEQAPHLGGNAITIRGKTADGHDCHTDPVVYLFLTQRYPLFTAWLRQLNIHTTHFTFENYFHDGYHKRDILITTRLWKFLLSPTNILNHIRIMYYFRQVIKTIRKLDAKGELNDDMLMENFEAKVSGVHPNFFKDIFYPLLSFAFHCDPQLIPKKPCGATLRSYALVAKDPSGAYCITNGVESYIHHVQQKLRKTHIILDSQVVSVFKNPLSCMWELTSINGETRSFDDIVFAIWPNQVADMLSANRNEQNNDIFIGDIIQHFSGIKRAYCRATVHNDNSVMPTDKRNWVTYSYKHLPSLKNVAATIWSGQTNNTSIFTTYDWAYSLSSLPDNNISGEISAVNIHFRTPPDTILNSARTYICTHQGVSNLWFAGSYLKGTGFHEDGLVSALEVVRLLEPASIHFPRLKGLMDSLNQQKNSS